MPVGAECRVRVKSFALHQAYGNGQGPGGRNNHLVRTKALELTGRYIIRRRYVSPGAASAIHITSICEDGLGLTDWWKNASQDDDGGQEEEHGNEEEQFVAEDQTKEEQEAC
jgi:hypothetical protein